VDHPVRRTARRAARRARDLRPEAVLRPVRLRREGDAGGERRPGAGAGAAWARRVGAARSTARRAPAALRRAPGALRRAPEAVRRAPAALRRAPAAYATASPRTVAVASAGAGLALALIAVAAAGPWTSAGQRRAEAAAEAGATTGAGQAGRAGGALPPDERPAWHAVADVLAPAPGTVPATSTTALSGTTAPGTAASGADPTAAGLAAALGPLLSAAHPGTLTAAVADPETGRLLYSSHADTALTPASTNKLATATAALEALGPDHRFTTRTVFSGGTLTLVGGGDPSLTAAHSATYASLADLARRTAAELKATAAPGSRPSVRLTYDTSLFAAPALHPIGVNGNIALVQALTSDEGRVDPSSTEEAARWPDPAAHAAAVFADLLRAQGVAVRSGPVEQAAPAGATAVAEVASPPLSDLVERMLTQSDNDFAETLGHQVAVAEHLPATFTGAAQAVEKVLSTRLGIPLGAARLYDSSGLDSSDALPAAVLTRILAVDASAAHPELRSVISGMPIAGFTGTLDDRIGSAEAAGLVHAKTGSLTGVDTLAGTVVDGSGRLLVFAFMANGDGGYGAGREALDALAARLAACGCR